MKYVARAEAERETPVFEGAGKVKTRIAPPAIIMAYPLSVAMDVRSVGVSGHVPVFARAIFATPFRHALPRVIASLLPLLSVTLLFSPLLSVTLLLWHALPLLSITLLLRHALPLLSITLLLRHSLPLLTITLLLRGSATLLSRGCLRWRCLLRWGCLCRRWAMLGNISPSYTAILFLLVIMPSAAILRIPRDQERTNSNQRCH
jgi:hypothetical protein